MKIVFATNNPNKIEEIRQLMPEGIEILSLKDINCFEELPETSDTLEDNAPLCPLEMNYISHHTFHGS